MINKYMWHKIGKKGEPWNFKNSVVVIDKRIYKKYKDTPVGMYKEVQFYTPYIAYKKMWSVCVWFNNNCVIFNCIQLFIVYIVIYTILKHKQTNFFCLPVCLSFCLPWLISWSEQLNRFLWDFHSKIESYAI